MLQGIRAAPRTPLNDSQFTVFCGPAAQNRHPSISAVARGPWECELVRAFSVGCAAGLAALVALAPAHAGSRLLATGGVTQVEGSAGGGLTPWALIAGLGTNRQIGGSASCTRVSPDEYRLDVCSLAVGIRDRVELSVARQRFHLGDVVPGESIDQTVVGAKVRLLGDAVYDQDRWWPQLALGAQYKRNADYDFVPQLIGARHGSDTDFYLAATKVYLAGPLSRTWLVNGTVRATRANQFGILGFGGDRSDGRSLRAEGSVAVFLDDSLVLGAEYRQKPDKLSAFEEENAWDAFLAWFPCKNFSVTAAYVDLGNVAIHPQQRGWYLSLQTGL